MAITLNTRNTFNATTGQSVTQSLEYELTQTGGPDNLTAIADAFDDHADWVVTRIEGPLYREFRFTFAGTGVNATVAKWINNNANITDNREGTTVFIFNAAGTDTDDNPVGRTFFQMFGSSGPTINIGLEQGGNAIGKFELQYRYGPQLWNSTSPSAGPRPVDQGVRFGNPNQERFAFVGYPSSGSFNTPTTGGSYFDIVYQADYAPEGRIDFDFLDNGMTGTFGMTLATNNITSTNSGSNPHSLASNYTLTPGSGMSAFNAVEVNVYADSESNVTPQGAFVNRFPSVFLRQLGVADTDQFNILRTRGPDGASSAITNAYAANHGLVIPNYPFNTYKTISLGVGADSSDPNVAGNPSLFLDPQTSRGDRFDQIRTSIFNAARGNIFAGSGYTVRFRTPAGELHTNHGFVIRKRNANSLFNGLTDRITDNYNQGAKDVFNNELEYYAWEVDTDEVNEGTKSGYSLDWYYRPTKTSGSGGGNVPDAKVLYTGSYDVWHGVPSGTPVNMTKTPYNATTTPDRAVTDTVVQTIPSQFNPANALPLEWSARGSVSGSGMSFNNTFTSATIDQNMNLDTMYATLAFGVSEVVQYWSALSQADKNTNSNTYCGSNGIFKNLIDHDCNLASVNGTVLEISDKDSDTFLIALGTASPFAQIIPTKGTNLDTVVLSHGYFDAKGTFINCATNANNHAYFQGVIRNPITYSSYSPTQITFRAHDRMSGAVELRNATGSTRYVAFDDCAIASGASLELRRDPTQNNNDDLIVVTGAPAGTTVAAGANVNINLANTLVVTRDLFSGEAFDTTDRGRLDIFDANQTLIAGNVTGVYSDSGVTYTATEAEFSTLTGTAVAVWSRTGYAPVRRAVNLGSAGATTTTTMTPVAAPTFPTEAAAAVNVVLSSTLNSEIGFDADSDILTIGIEGATGGNIPSASLTAELLARELFGTEQFNRLCSVSQTAAESVEFFGTAYAVVNFNHIRFTPAATATQTIGFVSGTGSSTRTVNFVSGGVTYHMNIPADSPVGLTEQQVEQIVSTQIQTVTDNQRNISLGIPV